MKQGWEIKTLGEVCDFRRGLTYSKSDEVSFSSKIVLRSNNIDLQTNKLDFSELKYLREDFEIPVEKYVIKNSLLICVSNGSKIHLGKVAVIPDNLNYAFGGFMGLLLPRPNIDSYFLYYNLLSDKYKKFIKSLSDGANINNLKYAQLKDFSLPVPPLPEQQAIVARLDSAFAKIDVLKANAQKQLENAKALFQNALKDAMTPKDGWEEKTVDEISIEMFRGSGITKEQITQTGFPCVRYGEIYTKYNYWFNCCLSHTDENKIQSKKYFENGDILFAITGESVEDIGKCIAYTGKDKCLAGGDIVVLKHKQEPRFLAYALSTPDAIRQKGLGKTKLKVVHTNIPSLKSITINIPPIEKQIEIADRLDFINSQIQKLKENYTKTIALCDDMKQALLRETFE